jgi:hypothetical protein
MDMALREHSSIQGENVTTLPPLPKRFRHHVMLSYASTDAPYVHAVRDALREKGVKVFDYADGMMVGEELEKGLEDHYTNDAPFCVVFLSPAYLKSTYTKQELAIVQRVATRKTGYMLPVIDGTIVPEIEKIVWLDKRTLTAEELARRLFTRICQPPRKPWWFYSTELQIASAAVLLALILFARPAINHFRPSKTAIRSVNANEQAIVVHVENSGPKSATIVGQRLKFGALPIENAELRLDKSQSATILPGEHDVTLISRELLTKCGDEGIRPNKWTVEPLLLQQPVTLQIDIHESNDAPGHSTPRMGTIPAARLKPLVRKLVSGRDSPC